MAHSEHAAMTLVAGYIVLIVSAAGLEPSAVTAFQARGGAAVAGLLLQLFLWWRWIGTSAQCSQ